MSLFGKIPIECPDLAKRIVGYVRSQNPDENNCRGWTNSVKAALRDIGHELNFEVYPEPQGGEFLLDVIWYSEAGGIELAAESEWHTKPAEVLADFQKLVYVKSPVKVMIYWVESHARGGERVLGEMVGYMEKYNKHLAGEEYLFVAFGRRCDDRCYWYVAPQDGTNKPISLIHIQLNHTVAAPSI